MANLDNLGYKSITDMTTDEAIEHLRQIRLSRRVPKKATKAKKTALTPKLSASQLQANQAAELLKILTGGK